MVGWALGFSEVKSNQYLFTLDALHGKLLFVAGNTKVLIVFGDETLCPNRLLAVVADKAGLVPAVALVFHLPSTCNETRGSAELLLAKMDAICSSLLPDRLLSVIKQCS